MKEGKGQGKDTAGEKLQVTDSELIALYLRGDEGAFETLYNRYRRPFYGFLNKLISNRTEADEIFEETWIKVIERLDKYRDDGRFSAWLFRIAKNLFIDKLRKAKIVTNLNEANDVEIIEATTDNPVDMAEFGDLERRLKQALDALPTEQKEVFVLRQNDLSFKEIAEKQGKPLNTVLSRMQYALKNLRRSLGDINKKTKDIL